MIAYSELATPIGEVSYNEYELWLQAQESAPIPSIASGKVSVVMPVCETPLQFIVDAYESVKNQTYDNWELCIHDDSSEDSSLLQYLAEISKTDSRVKLSYGDRRSGIASATNSALKMASGKWVAFLDHDDVLHRDALAWTVTALTASGSQIVYTDHDVISESGRRFAPFLKPDWSLDLFLSQMYLGHLLVMDRQLLGRVGGLRSETDGAQDYDLVLRCLSIGAKISHVPKVLYHWRQHSGSTSSNASSKPYAHHAGRKAIQDYVSGRYPGSQVQDSEFTFCYDVRYVQPGDSALVSVVIPTRDRVDLLQVCVSTLLERTRYPSFEVVIIDNGSVEPETKRWFEEASLDHRVRVVRADVPFNWSALNNLGALESSGDVLVFLNNDTEVIDDDWLGRLVEVALRDDVGVCGPLLLYGDGSIQHAGVVVGMGGWADHVFKGQTPVHHQDLFVSPMMRRNVLAVTGACMAVETMKFRRLGGFDETFVVCGSDVELCLRAHGSGLLNVYVPEAKLIHHESKSRDPRDIPESDFKRSAEAYGAYRAPGGDPFYNRNLNPMFSSPKLNGVQ